MSPSIHKQIITQSFSNIPLCSNIQHSTFPHQPKAGGPPFLSRTGNVSHAFLFLAFLFLRFRKVEEVQHIIVIPSDSHSGINYPPTFVGPPFLSRKELHTACFPFAKLLYVYLFIRDHSTFPCNPHGGVRGLWASAHQAYFPSYKHTAFYFPPSSSKDRAVNSMEIKDFIILWTYSQWRQAIVVIPPLSPERTFVLQAFLF